MNGVFVFFLVMFFVSVFFFFRNQYTWQRMNEARELIYIYCLELIEKRQYDSNCDYFEEMKIEYDKYLFNLSLWGKNSGIKKEYQYLFKTK